VGELWIGGSGVARGYLNRPDLTAEKFRPDPAARGKRVFATGDLGKWRPDGNIEFVGRADQQVKVRGWRVELGEIESVLGRHPTVRDAVVVAREATRGSERRVVAYVITGQSKGGEQDTGYAERLRVEQWREVFDSVLDDQVCTGAPAQGQFSLTGWNSTYTGQPIPAEQMREQVDQTVERILDGRPRRVLEIGCGTGLLLFRIAPRCERYVGTDLSTLALDYVRRQAGPKLPLELWQRSADDFDGIEPGSFDAVVLNSVVQYFPSAEYLLRVIEGAVNVVAPNGRVFVGDVRHFDLWEPFAASVQAVRTPGLNGPALRERIREHLATEQELLISPNLFRALRRRLPRLSHAEIRPKRGRGRNELAAYRYDVVLHLESKRQPAAVERWLDWQADVANLAQLRAVLTAGQATTVVVRGVPNARVAGDVERLRRLHGGDAPVRSSEGVDPEDVWGLVEDLPYRVDLSWGSSDAEGRFDVLIWPCSQADETETPFHPSDVAAARWKEYTNDPLRRTEPPGLVSEFRQYLQDRLPDHMVPSAIVTVDAFPLTRGGKVDRGALPEPERWGGNEGQHVLPRTEVERVLVEIWQEVLGLEGVGVEESFFELGGDSILSLQVVARARQAGVRLTAKQMFEQQTIAGLARVAGSVAGEVAGREEVGGEVPLTPVQRWFFEQDWGGGHQFNHAVMLSLRQGVDFEALGAAIEAVLQHHDALRLRFKCREGVWRQGYGESAGEVVRIDLGGLWGKEQGLVVQRTAAALQGSLDLATGPLMRVALFERGEEEGLLLLVSHHLVVDGVSWRILLEDVETAYRQLATGHPVSLPGKTSSFQHWASWLGRYADSGGVGREGGYWRGVEREPVGRVPVDHVRGVNTSQSARVVRTRLSRKGTAALLREVPAAYHTQVSEVLLTALGKVLREWTGSPAVVVEAEGHGREAMTEGVDLSRTVGWFTTLYPVRLGAAWGEWPAGALQAVKEQWRQIPQHGLGYGVLRYLGSEGWEGGVSPEVSFNYLGQFDQIFAGSTLFAPAAESPGATVNGKSARAYLLEVTALLLEGQLQMSWVYSASRHRRSTIIGLARRFTTALRQIIRHCQSPEAGGYTPSDFPYARLSQEQLARIAAAFGARR